MGKKLSKNEWNEIIQKEKSILFKLGYTVYRSLKAGKDSTYTYNYEDKNSGSGWDDESSVIHYLKSKLNLCAGCMEKLTDNDILFLEPKCKNCRN